MRNVDAGLTAWELDRLAVLRVIALAAEPDAVKVSVWRADVVALLRAVDRLTQSVHVESLMVVHTAMNASVMVGTATVDGRTESPAGEAGGG